VCRGANFCARLRMVERRPASNPCRGANFCARLRMAHTWPAITFYFLLFTFYSSLLTPYSLLFTLYSLLLTPYSLLLTPYSLLITPYSLLFTPYSLLLTSYSLLLTPYSLLLTLYSLLITPYSLLLTCTRSVLYFLLASRARFTPYFRTSGACGDARRAKQPDGLLPSCNPSSNGRRPCRARVVV
jgi:hypothetical protein